MAGEVAIAPPAAPPVGDPTERLRAILAMATAPAPNVGVAATSAPTAVVGDAAAPAAPPAIDPVGRGIASVTAVQTPTAPSPGPIKRGLSSFLYGAGQAALQHVELPTDYEKQQNSAHLAIAQQAADDTSQLRQAQISGLQQKADAADQGMAPFTFANDETVHPALRGKTMPFSAAQALQKVLLPAQVKADASTTNAQTAADAKVATSAQQVASREDISKAMLNYRQAMSDRNYGIAQQHIALARAGLGQRQQGLNLRQQMTEASLYGLDMHGQALPGSAQIDDGTGGLTTVGSRFAPVAVKQQKTVATFNDLQGSVRNLRSAIQQYQIEGGNVNDAKLAAAAADPASTVGKVIQGKLITGGLTPTQLRVLNAQRQTVEQAGILRSTTGGTNSEQGAQRILETVPQLGRDSNESSFSKLDEQEQVLGRLISGQTGVHGGVSARKSGAAAPATPSAPSSSKPSFLQKFGGVPIQ